MSREIRMKQAYLRGENKKWAATMARVSVSDCPKSMAHLTDQPEVIFRSSQYLAQAFAEKDGARRLTISRTMINEDGNWLDGSTWDDLMRVKSQCGYGDLWAVEIYPPDDEIVNVANMRHLWLTIERPAFAWQREQ